MGTSAFCAANLLPYCAIHLAFSHHPSRFFAPSISLFRTIHFAFLHLSSRFFASSVAPYDSTSCGRAITDFHGKYHVQSPKFRIIRSPLVGILKSRTVDSRDGIDSNPLLPRGSSNGWLEKRSTVRGVKLKISTRQPSQLRFPPCPDSEVLGTEFFHITTR